MQGAAHSAGSGWAYSDLKILNAWGGTNNTATDIVAMYYKADASALSFRVDVLDMLANSSVDLYIAVDYAAGGVQPLLPGASGFAADIPWNLLLSLSSESSPTIVDSTYSGVPGAVLNYSVDTRLDYFAVSISRAAMKGWDGSPFTMQGLTAVGGSRQISDSTHPVLTTATTGRAKLVAAFGNMFSGYGPDSLSWYNGYALDSSTRPGELRGTKYLLDAFQNNGLPLVSIDGRLDVLPGLEALGISDRIRNMTATGLLQLAGVATYGYQMAWQPNDVNLHALTMTRTIRDSFGLPQSQTFVPYEGEVRLENLGTIKSTGYSAIYAGDRYGYWFGGWITDWSNSTAVHERIALGEKMHMVDGVKVFFDTRNGNYQGAAWDPRWGKTTCPGEYDLYVGSDKGLHDCWRRILLDLAMDPDQQKYFTIGTDLSLTPWLFQDVAEWNAEWLAAHPWIDVTTFDALLQLNWTPIDHGTLALNATQPLDQYPLQGDISYNSYFWQFYYGGVSDGHSPLIPQGTRIESYFGYVPYLANGERIPSGMKMGDATTPGTIIYSTLSNLRTSPENELTDLAWYAYFVSVAEQTFHSQTNYSSGQEPGTDWGGAYLHPATKIRANFVGRVNIIVAAAHWADQVSRSNVTSATRAYATDLDLDGTEEYVLENNRVFAVFDGVGGRLEYAFSYNAKGPLEVVAPLYSDHVPGLFGQYGFADGITQMIPTRVLSSSFYDAAFAEETNGYQYSLFNAEVLPSGLVFTSADGKVVKTMVLNGTTITGSYFVQAGVRISVGFGLPTSMYGMFSKDWENSLTSVNSTGTAGWRTADGGYATVSPVGATTTSFVSVLDQADSADGLRNYTSASGHWFFFPYNSALVSGEGDFSVALSFAAPSSASGETTTTRNTGQPTSATGSGIPEFPYQLLAGSALAAIVVLSYLLTRRVVFHGSRNVNPS